MPRRKVKNVQEKREYVAGTEGEQGSVETEIKSECGYSFCVYFEVEK